MPQTCLLVDAVLPRTGTPADRAIAIVGYRRRYCEYLFRRHQVSLHY
ncbi:MAG: hypothetical protein J4G06_04460 [Caldilineaceae bacterium]|nr:hypothetical protein [Caldilineaceae bacterium]